jgi:5-methylcytosine-specific restriction endonuclease McrA
MLRSKRKTAEQVRASDERGAWSKRYAKCWCCGGRNILDTHEIVRRSETADWHQPANWTRLCRSCHEEAHGGFLTKGVLMTLKLIHDPGEYDAAWIRAHALRKDWEPEPLPRMCQWCLRVD